MTLYSRKMEPLANDSFEARIVRALEQEQKTPTVPADFMARVTSALPTVRPARKASHAGRTMMLVVAAALLIAMLWLAPHSAASINNRAFDLELAVVVLLASMVWGLVRVWDRV